MFLRTIFCFIFFLAIASAFPVFADPIDDALRQAEAEKTSEPKPTQPAYGLYNQKLGEKATLRLLDLGLTGIFSVGGSTEPDQSLRLIEAGGHDPSKRGFNIQGFEMSLSGAVDPYFAAYGNIEVGLDELTGETEVELEEAYAVTRSLPFGLQVKGGHYFTEFGIINPTHPHAWDWMDIPVINARIFGGDGQRAPGAQISWLVPVPFYLNAMVGAQNAVGENMPSFLANSTVYSERAIGGRPFFDRNMNGLAELLYFARLETSTDITQTLTTKMGISSLFGPNATGTSGKTRVLGADFLAKYVAKNNFRGTPYVKFQGEFIYRDFKADAFNDIQDPTDETDDIFYRRDHLRDLGFYSQILMGWSPRWEAGVRYEYATGSGESVGGRGIDALRDDRSRISPLLIYKPTEFSRLRLQANVDNADHLTSDDNVFSLWFGLDFILGTHPPHKF